MGYAALVFCCAACLNPAQANPTLVMSIPARWDGTEYVADPQGTCEPICVACARQLLERFEREHLLIPNTVRESDYFERAYGTGADERDL
jgi:hypothetical protein